MKFGVLVTAVMWAALSASAGFAFDGRSDDQTMIEVGAGGAFVKDQDLEVLLKVEYKGFNIPVEDVLQLVVGKLKVTGTGDASLVDVQFVPFAAGGEQGLNRFYVEVGGVTFQRNVGLGNGGYARITAMGFSSQFGGHVAKNIEAYGGITLDLVGLGLSRFGGKVTPKMGMGFQAEAGVIFAKKFRIAIGERFDHFEGNSKSRVADTVCTDYYDASHYDEQSGVWIPGQMRTDCVNHYVQVNDEQRDGSTTYLDLAFDLSKNISLFGQARYTVYSADLVENEVASDIFNTGFQALFGVAGKW